jgi:hypothetical protein
MRSPRSRVSPPHIPPAEGASVLAMPSYPVTCDCGAPALFKIAAAWSDGTTRELKTYFLSCAGCRRVQFLAAGRKQRLCRLAPGETLDVPRIYELANGSEDREFVGGDSEG